MMQIDFTLKSPTAKRNLLAGTLVAVCALVCFGVQVSPYALRYFRQPQPAGWQRGAERWPSRAYPAGKLHVLFVGNSYTFYNDLPSMVQELSAHETRPVEFEMVTIPGQGLDAHWKSGVALQALRSRHWDYVILQEYSLRPIDDKASFFKYGTMFNECIQSTGARTMLYMTWARKATPQTQAVLTDAYTTLGSDLNATVAPVGVAWEESLKARPSFPLHVEDGSHPQPQASYLAACVFYSTLYGKSARGLPHKLELHPARGMWRFEIKAEDAAYLQEIADRAMARMKEDRASVDTSSN